MSNITATHDPMTAPDVAALMPWLVSEPDEQGEQSMRCPLHDDRNASASVNFEKSLWRCFAGCPDGEVGELLWRLEQLGVRGGGTTVTAKGDRGGFTADVGDLRSGKSRRPQKLPSRLRVDGWHNALMRNDERLSELHEKRGLTRETVERFKLGWDEDAEAYTIPFVEDRKIVNVKWYRVSPRGEQRKMWGVRGHNVARLYPEPPTESAKEVLVCAGEMDTLLAIQHGFEAVTGSGGEGTWRDEWNRHFTGRTVYGVYDRDKAGDEGFEIVRQQLAGKAAEVRKVVLPLPWREKGGLDLTDLYHKVGADQFAQALRSLLDAAPDESEQHAAYEGLVIPDGWEVNDAGISWIKDGTPVPFSHAPVVIRERWVDDEGTAALCVGWKVHGRWIERTWDRGVLADTQKIKRLADFDAPVHSGNASRMVNYLADLEAANWDRLPEQRMTRRLGWTDEDLSEFVCSPTDDGVEFHGPAGTEELAASLTGRGTLSDWQEAVSGLQEHPRAALGIYASLAAPLLRVMDARPFTVDWAGETSRGKTTTLQIAASCWGAPTEDAGFMQNWHATRNAIETWAGMLRGLPLLLDETKMAEKDEVVTQIVYDVGQGRGKGRADRVGGLRDTASWSTVVLTTGEQPIVTFSQDGGTRARVVEVEGSPFGDGRRSKLVRGLVRGLTEAHGHAGPLFVSELLAHREEWPRLRDRYHDLVDELSDDVENPVVQRRAKHVAVMKLASELAMKFGVLGWQPEEMFWPELLEESVDAEHDDPAKAALQQVCQWAFAQEPRFLSLDPNPSPYRDRGPRGWAGRWDDRDSDLCYLPDVLKSILRERGHAYESVVKIWGDRGWIKKSDGKNSQPVRVRDHMDKDHQRMVVIPAAILAELNSD